MIPSFRGIENFEIGQARFDEIQHRFVRAARTIMFDYYLVFHQFSEPRIMQITSLELYSYCAGWQDPNTDRDPEQLRSGTWYVVRKGNDASASRIDITAGCRCENIYCGLLIRGIDGVDGAGKAIRRIVRGKREVPQEYEWHWLPEEIDVIEQIRGRDVCSSGPLRIAHRETSRPRKTEVRPRKNLRTDRPNWTGDREPWHEPLRVVVVV